MNGILLVFNMVPAFPLDGGRVFRGIVWAITGDYLTSTRVAGVMGIAFSWLLFIGGFLLAWRVDLWSGLWFFFLAMFLRNAAQSSIAYAQLQELLRGVTVEDMMRRQPTAVDANQSLRDVVDEFFLRYPYKAYPVMEDGRFVGILTLRALQEVDRNQWDTMRAGDLVAQRGTLPVLRPDEPVLGAMRKLAESDQSRLPVVENGHLVGLLCSRDIMDFLEIRTGLAVPREEAVLVDKA
jgi:CBS domain-containing protein